MTTQPAPSTLRPPPDAHLLAAGWTDTTAPPSLSAEYRHGIVRLEYHATCETWRAKVGGNEWGYPAPTMAAALARCSVPPPAVDDVRLALATLTAPRPVVPVQASLFGGLL
jgi:hypothetical protein